MRIIGRLACAMVSASAFAFSADGAAAAANAPPVPALPEFTYADLVDLADSAQLVARARLRKLVRVENARAPGLRPGQGRFYVQAETVALLTGAAPLGEASIALAVADTLERGLADAVIVTGAATGHETDLSDVAQAKAAAKGAPVLVGSGVTVATIVATLRLADAVIVGTGLKIDGITTNPVDVARVRALVAAARAFS